MWWNLPTEILEIVLKHISFDDYVNLTRTNGELRRTLDTPDLWNHVYQNVFGPIHHQYEWSDTWKSKTEMWKLKKEFREYLQQFVQLSSGMTIGDKVGPLWQEQDPNASNFKFQKQSLLLTDRTTELWITEDTPWAKMLEKGIRTFAQEKYFPIVVETYNQEMQKLKLLIRLQSCVPVTAFAFVSKLLQIQNMSLGLKYYSHAQGDVDLERGYFEMARFDASFHELAPVRLQKLERMRTLLRDTLPISKGVLGFQSESQFSEFLEGTVKLLLQCLLPVTQNRRGYGQNILNVYKGNFQGPALMYIAIVAKVLQEEIFLKIKINVAGCTARLKTKCSQLFIVVGDFYVECMLKPLKVRAMTERTAAIRIGVDQNILHMKYLEPRSVQDVVREIYEASDVPAHHTKYDITRLASQIWQETPIYSMCRGKFLLAGLLLRYLIGNGNGKFDTAEGDLFLYLNAIVGNVALENNRIDYSLGEYFRSMFAAVPMHRPFTSESSQFPGGCVVFNNYQKFIGVILGSTQGKCCVCPADSFKVSENFTSNLERIGQDTFENPENIGEFLEWLVRSESIQTLCMLVYSRLSIADGVPKLLL